MIKVVTENPTIMWMELGRKFFKSFDEVDHPVDIKLGDRRFIVISGELITDWPKEWVGTALFEAVGYSPKGTKMDTLRRTYLDVVKWNEFLAALKEDKGRKGFSAWGMNFKCRREGKGGCLSALHLIRHRKMNVLVIHGKIAEVPRKFLADLILVRDLLKELNLWPMKVVFSYSVMYYSIVGLRAYIPILGKAATKERNELPITDHRNYQVGIIEAINKFAERFNKREKEEGLWKLIDLKTGTWK